MGIEAILTFVLPLIPGLLDSITKMYATMASKPETPTELKAHYAQIAADLDAVNQLVQNAPEPPEGSGA